MLIVALLLMLPAASRSATSTVTVSAMVPSATSLDISGCTAASRQFGTLPPGSSAVTPTSCRVSYGSSNDVARLRMTQQDGRLRAMHRPATGPLDTAWGSSGQRLVATSPGSENARAMALAADGSAYVAGFSDDAGTWRVRVTKLLSDGSVDTSFGTSGVLTTPLIVDPNYQYEVGLELQPDGKLVVGGHVDAAGGSDFAAARYSSSGGADASFGTAGLATVALGDQQWGHDVLVQPDGKLLLVGETIVGGAWDLAVARLHADGTLDGSYGSAGVAVHDTGGSQWDFALAADLLPDGRLVTTGVASGPYRMALAMLRSDGSLDPTFGSGGWVIQAAGPSDSSRDVRVLANGDVVAVGFTSNGTYNSAAIGRFTATGAPAAGWGASGWRVFDLGVSSFLRDVRELGDGRLVATGARSIGGVTTAAVLRLEASGQEDASFDGDGWATHQLGSGASSGSEAHVDVDGTLTIAGTGVAASQDFAVARLSAVSIPDFGASYDWSAGSAVFGACVEQVSSGTIAAPWVAAGVGGCTAANGPHWQPVAARASDSGATVATASSIGATGFVDVRWGLRTSASQPPGRYLAPITFQVVAP